MYCKDPHSTDPLLKPEEFLRLFFANQASIFSYIFTILPDWSDAEDVLQETSIVLWRNFGEFQPDTNFRAWACKTAFYQVLSFRKRHKKIPLPLSQETIEALSEESNELSDVLDDRLRALRTCVKKLKARDQDLLHRFYGVSTPTKVLAEQLGRPIGTITKSLTRIRRALLDCVERSIITEEVL